MAACRLCEQALVIELDPDSFDESAASSSVGSAVTAPDDLLLLCGCHFHWSVPEFLFLLPLLTHSSSMGGCSQGENIQQSMRVCPVLSEILECQITASAKSRRILIHDLRL
jgi:hypothetical protein